MEMIVGHFELYSSQNSEAWIAHAAKSASIIKVIRVARISYSHLNVFFQIPFFYPVSDLICPILHLSC